MKCNISSSILLCYTDENLVEMNIYLQGDHGSQLLLFFDFLKLHIIAQMLFCFCSTSSCLSSIRQTVDQIDHHDHPVNQMSFLNNSNIPPTLCWFPCAASASSISPARSVSPRTRKATARLYVKSALEAISSEAVPEAAAAEAAAAE